MPEHNSATPYQCLSVPAPYFAVKTLPLPCEPQLFLSMSPLSFAIVSHHNPITMIFCSITLQVKTMTKRRLNDANLCYAIPQHTFAMPFPGISFLRQHRTKRFLCESCQCKAYPMRIWSMPSPNNSVPLPHGASPSQLVTFP